MELTLYEYVVERLASSKQTYQEIAEGSGVPKRTVEKIARREIEEPGVNKIQALADYFRAQEEAAA